MATTHTAALGRGPRWLLAGCLLAAAALPARGAVQPQRGGEAATRRGGGVVTVVAVWKRPKAAVNILKIFAPPDGRGEAGSPRLCNAHIMPVAPPGGVGTW